MAGVIASLPKFQFSNALGLPMSGGTLTSYLAGTTTPVTTYQDEALTSANTNPINLDSRGECTLWLDSTKVYKFVLKNAAGVTQWTVDNITNSTAFAKSLDTALRVYVDSLDAALREDLAASSGSSMSGFIQSGTGAVETTVQSKLREIVSVKDYGAVGDGATNDTTAIANAIATGKSVFFPEGTYVSDTQTIATVGQSLFGSGQLSIILARSAGANLLKVQADYVSIADLRLNGVETGISNTTFAIYTSSAYPANYLSIERVVISGALSTTGFPNAIKFDDSCNYGSVRNCKFDRLWGTTSGHGYGVLSGGVTGLLVECNWFVGSSGRGRHAVYFSAGATACQGNYNYVIGFGYEALTTFSQAAQPSCTDIQFVGNTTYNCCTSVPGISTGHISAFGHQVRCKIIGNVISGSKGCGIKVDGTNYSDLYDTQIFENTIVNSDYIGIDIVAGVRGSLVSNYVKDSSQAAVGTYSNIRLAADPSGVGTGVTGWLVSSNKCPTSTTARSAFQFNLQTPYPTNISLKGNMFESGTTSAIENSQTANGAFAIDGRLRFSQSYDPPSIANGACTNANWTVYGVATGDIVTVTHDQNTDGCVLYGYVSSTNTVTTTIANNSGAAKDISAGNIYINVWKSSP